MLTWAPLFQSPYQSGAAVGVLDEAAALQRDGALVVPQVGCRPLELRFDFAATGFGLENNPIWRPFMALPRAERRRRFGDPAFRSDLRDMSHGFVAALAPGWDRLVLRLPATPATARWRDRSVAEVAGALGTEPMDTFCDLVLADDLEGQWGALIFNVDEDEMAALIRHPAGLLALSDAGAHGDTLCDQGFTTTLLGHWVRERGALPLEEAVRLGRDAGATVHVGPIVTSGLFYDPDPQSFARWKRLGHVGVEMEAAMMYTIAAVKGIEAVAMMTVSDVLGEHFPEHEVAALVVESLAGSAGTSDIFVDSRTWTPTRVITNAAATPPRPSSTSGRLGA